MKYFIDTTGVVHTSNPVKTEVREEGQYEKKQASDLFDKYGIKS